MSIGLWQIFLIVFLVLLLFGSKRIPALMRDIASGVKSFRKGLEEKQDPTDNNEKD